MQREPQIVGDPGRPCGRRGLNGTGIWPSAVVKLALVDDVDVKAEGPGDLVEEPGVGEEPLSPGALADGAAVVGSVQEMLEGCFGAAGVPLVR
jgi:hypothetical protein